MTKLTSTTTEGNFVLENQELATKDGFNHVSKLWYDKTMSYDDGMEMLSDRAKSREDILCKPKDMVPYFDKDKDGEVGLEYVDGRRFSLTTHALCQYGMRTDISTAFLKQMYEPCVVRSSGSLKYNRDAGDRFALYTVLKNGHRRLNPENKFRFRVYNDDNSCRAFLTEKYAPIDNRWYIEVLKEAIPGGRLSHFDRSNPDTLYGNVLIPDTIREDDDSDYGGMISISNCEIGVRQLSQTPSIFRAICMNGCIWGQTKGSVIKQRHMGKIDLKDLARRLYGNINSQIPLMNDGLEKFLETRDFEFGNSNAAQIIGQIAIENQFTKLQARTVAEEWVKNEGKRKDAFGIINAITRAGQHFSSTDWVKMDILAGDMVNGGVSRWTNLVKRASTFDDAKKEKVFGVSV